MHTWVSIVSLQRAPFGRVRPGPKDPMVLDCGHTRARFGHVNGAWIHHILKVHHIGLLQERMQPSQPFVLPGAGPQALQANVLDVGGQLNVGIHSSRCHGDRVPLLHACNDLQQVVGRATAVADAVCKEEKVHETNYNNPHTRAPTRRGDLRADAGGTKPGMSPPNRVCLDGGYHRYRRLGRIDSRHHDAQIRDAVEHVFDDELRRICGM